MDDSAEWETIDEEAEKAAAIERAVATAVHRVYLYRRGEWWLSLTEEKRQNILHRQRVRRQARGRLAYLRACTEAAHFKHWMAHRAATWLRRVVTVGCSRASSSP